MNSLALALAFSGVAGTPPNFATCPFWVRADLGWTAGTGAWNDQSGNGNNLTASTVPPIRSATGGPNNQATIGYTAASSMFHKSTFSLSQTYWLWIVCEWTDNYSANTYMVDGSSLDHGALLRYQTDGVEAYAGAGLVRGSGFTAKNFNAYLIKFAGSSSLVNVNDSAGISGSAGTNAAGGITLAAEGAGVGGFANANICEVAIFTTDPGFGSTTSLSLYRQQRYGF